MFELVIISGKGGTGKTSLVGSLAVLAKDKVLVDCDVDAADLNLILGGKTETTHDFVGGSRAEIIQDKCSLCGICPDYCRFDAIKHSYDHGSPTGETFSIDRFACEGCGVCAHFCPEQAIKMKEVVSGRWFISDTPYGPLIHARLGIAEANSGRLVSELRKKAVEVAQSNGKKAILIDGPPGIGCPVIASMTGVDYALIVTEPSISAFHDMDRLMQLAGHFGIRTGICINKYDINDELSSEIERYAGEKNSPVLARIPFDPEMTRAQLEGIPYMEKNRGAIGREIESLWSNLEKEISGGGHREHKSAGHLTNLE